MCIYSEHAKSGRAKCASALETLHLNNVLKMSVQHKKYFADYTLSHDRNENMKADKLVIGVLAHVDAGKTTLAESMLYLTGSIRSLGRVDHKNAFLDTFDMEKARGITIFSKQAELQLGDQKVTLVDTPGHVDFSAEMERTLQVLDYGVLIINGMDGVQGHVITLWKLLKRYEIPVFLFINKMDQAGTDKKKLMRELSERLHEHCIDFTDQSESYFENISMCEERVMEQYLETGIIEQKEIARLIQNRNIFPCYFGSALKVEGVEEFLEGIKTYTEQKEYPEEFGARVFKISRDSQGNRLTWLKVTGGSLKVKMVVCGQGKEGEKADQIRIYSGGQYQAVPEAYAGTVCAVTGLSKTYAGQGLGAEVEAEKPVLEPVLTYQIQLPDDCDVHSTFVKLSTLEEEEPQLHIVWDEESDEIQAQVMGEVQIEILKGMISERFGIGVEFGSGSIVYKETIAEPVEGVGHFEPLRHYAEVHLLLEPGQPGSGVQVSSDCSEDMLDRNWQRLVLTHLEEKMHRGVLAGAELTDVRITLIAGRAHNKHTEGGDFRQATYRAVRHGLKNTKNILLEPVYEFRLEVPTENIGRAMSDIQKLYGTFQTPVTEGNTSVLTGTAPVQTMRDYQREVVAYTRGEGRLFCSVKGYEPCHNAEEIIAEIGYDAEKDTANPTGSVFCAHGAGFVVSWDKVYEYMHIERAWQPNISAKEEVEPVVPKQRSTQGQSSLQMDKELEEIFTRTYGPVKQKHTAFREQTKPAKHETRKPVYEIPEPVEKYLLVDGYNIIFAWEELKELAAVHLGAARQKLMDILCNYQGYRKQHVILVFDAYKVEGHQGEVQKYHNIHVVYTKEAETADQYIEKTVHEIGKKYDVTVATSDGLEQMIIWGDGAKRMSARGLYEEIQSVNQEIREYTDKPGRSTNRLGETLNSDMAALLEEVKEDKKYL